jgi:hypothetical protein
MAAPLHLHQQGLSGIDFIKQFWPKFTDKTFDPNGWTLTQMSELWPSGVNFDPKGVNFDPEGVNFDPEGVNFDPFVHP